MGFLWGADGNVLEIDRDGGSGGRSSSQPQFLYQGNGAGAFFFFFFQAREETRVQKAAGQATGQAEVSLGHSL